MDGIETAEDLHGSALHHRLRPLRPGGEPVAAGARDRRLDHRHRHRDDPQRRRLRLQGLLRRRLPARRAARRRRRRGAERSWSASTSATPPTELVALAKAEFPQAKLLVRSYDREHALKLVEAGVDVQIRETFESALQVRRDRAARARRARGRGGGDRRGHPPPRRRALRAGNHRRSAGRPRPPARQCARSRSPSPSRGARVPAGAAGC